MSTSTATQLLLATAAGLHLAAFPQHREEGTAVAAFFVVVALLQLAGAMVVRPRMDRRLRLALASANIGLLGLWVVSRTVGLPGAGPEAVAVLDVLAVAAEAAAVITLLARPALRAAVRPGPALPAVALTAVLVCGAAVLWVPAGHGHHRDVTPVVSTERDVPHAHDGHSHGPRG